MTRMFCTKCEADLTADMYCHTCKEMLPCDQFYTRHDEVDNECFRSHCLVCERTRKNHRDKYNNSHVFKFFSSAIKTDLKESMGTEPMTEDEWLKNCKHFKGCAMCGKNDIQVRQYFIPRKQGGRYTRKNMLPMCPECCRHFRLKSMIDPMHLKKIRVFKLDLERLGKIYTFIKEGPQ